MPESKEEQAIGTKSKYQLVDYYLLEDFKEIHQEFEEPGLVSRIKSKLAPYKVIISDAVIYNRARAIKTGKIILHPSADVNGEPSARIGKDQNYAGFWAMVDVAIPNKEERRYIGLAANQMDVVRSHISYPEVVVCEKDQERAIGLANEASLIERFRPGPRVTLVVNDIFEEIKRYENKYNIFDLDLMCQLPTEKKINSWTETIYRAAYPSKIVVAITTGIGRKGNTEEKYNQKAGYLQRALGSVGFQQVGYSRFAYRDKIVPMRSERFILTKT